MAIFDIITLICCVLFIILWVVACILAKLYPDSHPKCSTVFFILSVISTSLLSVVMTNWIIEAVLT